MAEHRYDKRVDCDQTCILRLGDLHHVATVENFSLGGALVHFHSSPPSLHVGDNCIISMDAGSLLEYSCEVIRVETTKIALMFADTHKYKSVVQRVRNTIKAGFPNGFPSISINKKAK
jgi:hypothetical protein